MDHTAPSRFRRVLVALAVCCVAAGLVPATALAADSPSSAPSASAVHGKKKKHLKVGAALDKGKVKVNEKANLKGRLDLDPSDAADARADLADGSEPVVVQKLEAGVWVNLTTASCRPNGAFSLNLSFAVAAKLSLRVFHPETDLYAEASSQVFGLIVL
jgi:hypothetical protein